MDFFAAAKKKEWTGQYVMADETVPELARFRSKVGQVITVNEQGMALVDFQDGPWYDIATRHLRVVPKPEPKPQSKPEPKPAAEKKPAAKPAKEPAAESSSEG